MFLEWDISLNLGSLDLNWKYILKATAPTT